jgi:chromosome segregation ATPase
MVLGALLCGGALAQAQPDPRATRERELLRRSQAALREVQAQHEALAAEKTRLLQQHERLKGERDSVAQQARAGQDQARRARGDLQRLQVELDAERAKTPPLQAELERHKAEAARAAAELQALQLQLADARRESAGRGQANAAVTALLTRATAALAEAEARNRLMHAAGLAALQRYRSKNADDLRAQNEPFLGLAAVRIENEAEALQAELDKHRLVPAPR